MKRTSYEDDPIAYRISYSRIAQTLHLKSVEKQKDEEEQVEQENDAKKTAAKKTGGSKEAPAKRPRRKTVAELVKELVGEEPAQDKPADIEADALKLIEDAGNELTELGLPFVGRTWGKVRRAVRWREPKRLARFLDEVLEPATVVLYFSARIENGHRDAWLLDPARPDTPPDRRRRESDQEAWLKDYLGYLVKEGSSEGPSLPSRFWKDAEGVNYRVLYNIACMYARLGAPRTKSKGKTEMADAALSLALEHLASAISGAHGSERRALSEWSRVDPALKPLREGDREKGFEEALKAAMFADDEEAI
jgi:hypothetical protein